MYWYHYHPSTFANNVRVNDEAKYSTAYLQRNVGKPIRVTLNYTTNSSINQNVQYAGALKEVGNDYMVVTVKDEDVLVYTVNVARVHILKSHPQETGQTKDFSEKLETNSSFKRKIKR